MSRCKVSKFVLLFSLFAMCTFANALESLRVAIPNKIVTLDPIRVSLAQQAFTIPLIFESLVEATSEGEIKNTLISHWEFRQEKKAFRITIAPGHYFSDGGEVKAEDVVKTFKRLCEPDMPSATQLTGIQGCGSGIPEKIAVKVVNAMTVDFFINVHPSNFLYQLAFGRAAIFKEENGKFIGSGAYKVDAMNDEVVTLGRNPYSKHSVPVDKLLFVYVSADHLKDELQKNEIDFASMYLRPTVEDFTNPNYTRIYYSPNVSQLLVINPKKYPFDHVEFRRAFINQLYAEGKFTSCGAGLVEAYGIIPWGVGGSMANEKPSYDGLPSPEVAVAKVPNLKNKTVSLTFLRHVDRKNDCEESQIINVGKKFHLDITFKHTSDYPALIKAYGSGKADGYIELVVFTSRDPSTVLRRFLPNSKEPFYYYTSKEVESSLKTAWVKSVLVERFKTYREISKRIVDYANIFPLYYVGHTTLVHRCLSSGVNTDGLNFNPNSFLYLTQVKPVPGCER